jgi:hypothetical protein
VGRHSFEQGVPKALDLAQQAAGAQGSLLGAFFGANRLTPGIGTAGTLVLEEEFQQPLVRLFVQLTLSFADLM